MAAGDCETFYFDHKVTMMNIAMQIVNLRHQTHSDEKEDVFNVFKKVQDAFRKERHTIEPVRT